MSNFLMTEKPIKLTPSLLKREVIHFMEKLLHVPVEDKPQVDDIITLLRQKHIQISPDKASQEVDDYIAVFFQSYPTIAKYNCESAKQLKESIANVVKAIEQTSKKVNNKRNLNT